jgi:hypothetical protein
MTRLIVIVGDRLPKAKWPSKEVQTIKSGQLTDIKGYG